MFSAQNAEESGKTSGTIVEKTVEILVEDFESYTPEQQTEVFSKFSFSIRTFAHFFEFTVLGILAFIASLTFALPERLKDRQLLWRVAICAAFCLLYACSDEIHQMFSDGRAAQLLDICVDFSGSLLGIGATALITKNRKKEYK